MQNVRSANAVASLHIPVFVLLPHSFLRRREQCVLKFGLRTACVAPLEKRQFRKLVSDEEFHEYRREFARERRLAFKQYRRMPKIKDDPQSLRHYDWLAAYIHANRFPNSMVLAAMAHGLKGDLFDNFAESLAERGPTYPREVKNLYQLYHKLLGTSKTDVNLQMATAISDFDALRASAIRAADLAHTLGERKPDAARRVTLARAYRALYDQAMPQHRLASDLGDEIVRGTDREAYARLMKTIVKHGGIVRRKVEPLLAEVKSRLRSGKFTRMHLRFGEARDYAIQTRTKSVHQTYEKEKRYVQMGRPIGEVYDIYGVRIIVKREEEETDREVVEKLHGIKRAILNLLQTEQRKTSGQPDGVVIQAGNVEDYLKNPKPNGYRAIHIPFKWGDHRIEIQVLTDEMHRNNEYGSASKLSYKNPQLSPEVASRLNKIKVAADRGVSLEGLRTLIEGEDFAGLREQSEGVLRRLFPKRKS